MAGRKSAASNIKMSDVNDLFEPEQKSSNPVEKVEEVETGRLYPFHSHPFKVLDDEAMEEMVESIRLHGVLVPGIARPRAEGGYELLAGHRRRHALELAGETMMPVIIRELDGDESTLFMVDSNLQRENLLPSEKAWAYKMKLEAIRRIWNLYRRQEGLSCFYSCYNLVFWALRATLRRL